MAWFGKKKNNDVKEKGKNTANPDYKVYIWEDVGFSVRLVKEPFDAMRYVDEDKTPFIYSEENKFMELYPQDVKDLDIKLNEEQINKKIKDLQDTLKTIRAKPLDQYSENEPNTKDLEFEIQKWEAKKRALKFSASGSYVNFDHTGRVCFNFLRKGNSFYPFKWDTDTNTIHTAPEPVVKKAGILLRNKENKYNLKNLIDTATLILLVILVIGTIAVIFAGGWLWKKYDQSSLAESERKQLELQNVCSDIVIKNAKALEEMRAKYKKELNGTTDIYVQGLVPN